MATLASGTGSQFSPPSATGTIAKLVRLESALKPGTRVSFTSTWRVIDLPVVGQVHPGAVAAAAINNAYEDGKLVSNGHLMPLWPGDKAPASYDGTTRRLTVRWVTASSFVALVLGALAAITVGVLAVYFKVPPQIIVGAGVAIGLAFVAAYLIRWAFEVLSRAVGPGLAAVAIAAAILIPFLLLPSD